MLMSTKLELIYIISRHLTTKVTINATVRSLFEWQSIIHNIRLKRNLPVQNLSFSNIFLHVHITD